MEAIESSPPSSAGAEPPTRPRVAFHVQHMIARGANWATLAYARWARECLGWEDWVVYCLGYPNGSEDFHEYIKLSFPRTVSYPTLLAQDGGASLRAALDGRDLRVCYTLVSGEAHFDSSWIPTVSRGPRGDLPRIAIWIHSVFTWDPHGDACAVVSETLSHKHAAEGSVPPWVPHVVDFHLDPNVRKMVAGDAGAVLRSVLKIPRDAVVLGRHGGPGQFDVPHMRAGVVAALGSLEDVWFLFLHTARFVDHPRAIFLGEVVHPGHKAQFILACDAMIHGRTDGETFGLAIAEFAVLARPIITCAGRDNAHLDIMGDLAIACPDARSVLDAIRSLTTPEGREAGRIRGQALRRLYGERFAPDVVMRRFADVFLGGPPSPQTPTRSVLTMDGSDKGKEEAPA